VLSVLRERGETPRPSIVEAGRARGISKNRVDDACDALAPLTITKDHRISEATGKWTDFYRLAVAGEQGNLKLNVVVPSPEPAPAPPVADTKAKVQGFILEYQRTHSMSSTQEVLDAAKAEGFAEADVHAVLDPWNLEGFSFFDEEPVMP
jgi:hypothetical protein